eukprot:1142220-Pelagomonas_calceolata.AAC.3
MLGGRPAAAGIQCAMMPQHFMSPEAEMDLCSCMLASCRHVLRHSSRAPVQKTRHRDFCAAHLQQ